MISTCARRATIEDVPEINAVLNDADARRGMSAFPEGVEWLDAGPTFGSMSYFLFLGGFVLFVPMSEQSRVWEGHVAALRGYRGENALDVAASAVDQMFKSGDARHIIANVSERRRDLRAIMRALGFSKSSTTPGLYIKSLCDWKEDQRCLQTR